MLTRQRKFWFVALIVVLAFALVSCGGGATQAPSSSGGSTGGNTPSGGAAASQVVITTDSQGKTVEMKVGQQLLVKLGTEGNCKVDVTPTFLLNSVEGATLAAGEQALYEAKMQGAATVQATCDNSKQYNISVKISPAD